MKNSSFYIVLLSVLLCTGVSISFAATSTLSTTAPIVGTGAQGENAGNLIFEYEPGLPGPDEVSINANTLLFSGSFWSENAGWCTFNGLGADGASLTGSTDNMPMKGFAWCQNAGWIAFAPRGAIDTATLVNSDVFFTKSTGRFHGFAWSENMGWINMEGLMTDITAPSLNDFRPFAASGSKVFTLSEPSPTVPIGTSYKFTVDNWDSGNHIYAELTPSFTHDFRKTKLYHLTITDPFGNSSEGNLQVVADAPSDTLNTTYPIPSATPTTYASTFSGPKIGDGADTHIMNMSLRDQYGNPVINEPGIKTVRVRVSFNNNVDKDQSLLPDGVVGDAIQFPGTTFAGLSYSSGSIGTDSNTSGNYALSIASYAPTKVGYAFTNNDNISLQRFAYDVVANGSNSGVGEVPGQVEKKDKIGTNNLKFSPAIYVGSVTNADNWAIRQGYETTFNATILTGTTVPLSNQKVANILDIDTNNVLMSYQNPKVTSGGTKNCDGYMKTITTFNGAYVSTDTLCSRPDSSILLVTPTSSAVGFSWKPTIIYAAPASSSVKYTSEISYTNGAVDVKYPSYSRSNSSTTLADGTPTTGTGAGVINQSVKILGMSNARNTIDVLQGNDTNKVGSLTRTDIKNAIHKNVEIMTKGGVPSSANYIVYTEDKTISSLTWPAGKDTIIIKGGDLTINGDINGGSSMRGIIVLGDATGNGGNIYIDKNVANMATVLFADKSVVSGTSTSGYYSDTRTATGQLFLQGSMISDNTIGGASMTPLKCPYNVSGCDDQIAKRYDLNYFRFYTGTGSSSPGSAVGVPSAGNGYPFVIQYDNRLQTAPPPGFQITQ